MIRLLLVVLAIAVSGVSAQAQTATALPSDSFAWTIAEGLTAAQRYTYTLELDGALRAGPVSVTCGLNGTDARCVTPIPALTPGQHTVRVRATDILDGRAIDSDFSAPLSFVLIVKPQAPSTPIILPAGTVPFPQPPGE